MAISQIIELKHSRNPVEAIFLLHLSDNNSNNNSNAERFKREIQQLTGKPVYVAAERG